MQAKGIEMTYKANNGTLVPLHPYTIKEQILDWDMGEAYGPYVVTLKASGWSNKEQIVQMSNMLDSDRPICNKILSGTEQEMKSQSDAYNLIDGQIGVQSMNGQVKFVCTDKTPTIDIKAQVFWNR